MSKSNNKVALIVVDMINSYDFDDADTLRESVQEALPAMVDLVKRAAERGVKTIYVNDNHGAWHQGRNELVEETLAGDFPELVEPIAPGDDVDFVVKARHSIFYETPLEYLLRQEGIDELILVGQVTEQCILYSALDAYIRHFKVHVPPDAVACIHEHLADAALEMMQTNMAADLTPAAGLLAD
ncbi:MAG: isochorismatase hydrolase [Solirubrobacteraceae bacterium]|nr:isochorismatase hydrolase [Solirubrobacteraceae bacterium]